MRGQISRQRAMFSYVDLEGRIPEGHPIRKIRCAVDEALEELGPQFAQMYSDKGRPSIPPEQLVRALLLQIVFSIRSERQLMERINYDLLFRWFVDLAIDDPVWDPTVFTKSRERLMRHGVDAHFLAAINKQGYAHNLLSKDHFSVDGTLLEACASMKSFQPKDEDKDARKDAGDDGNFRGQRRSNETHQSTTDPDSRLFRKGYGKEAKLAHMGHILIENRNGFIVGADVTEAGTRQEWGAGLALLSRQAKTGRRTVGADKGYNVREFVDGCRGLRVTPHVTAKKAYSRIDGRTTSHAGYRMSQHQRKRVEEPFGWMKNYGLLRKLRHRGREQVDWIFRFTAAIYNLIKLQAYV